MQGDDDYSPEHPESDELICVDCFKRNVRGAADVNNARRRLQGGLKMQENFLMKYEDHEKKPKTWETRVKLRRFYQDTLIAFDALFEEQIAEYADPGELEKNCKKRKRNQ
jgi:hypothetical protein